MCQPSSKLIFERPQNYCVTVLHLSVTKGNSTIEKRGKELHKKWTATLCLVLYNLSPETPTLHFII